MARRKRAERRRLRDERRQARAERRRQQGGTRAGRVIRRVGRAVGRVAANVALAPLIPVMPAAMIVYKRRTGKKPPAEPLEFVKAWARDVMGKRLYDLDPVTIGTIVAAIISAIKAFKEEAKRKKERGEALTEAEQKLLDTNIEDVEAAQSYPEALAQLGEYLPIMREMYKEKTGQDLPQNPFKAAREFYQKIVVPYQKQGGFDFDYAAFEIWTVGNYEGEEKAYSFDLGTVVEGIISFFRAVRDRVREKRKKGKKVDKWEEAIADRVDKVEGTVREEVVQMVREDVKQKTGDIVWKILPIAAVAGLLLIVMAWARKGKR